MLRGKFPNDLILTSDHEIFAILKFGNPRSHQSLILGETGAIKCQVSEYLATRGECASGD